MTIYHPYFIIGIDTTRDTLNKYVVCEARFQGGNGLYPKAHHNNATLITYLPMPNNGRKNWHNNSAYFLLLAKPFITPRSDGCVAELWFVGK